MTITATELNRGTDNRLSQTATLMRAKKIKEKMPLSNVELKELFYAWVGDPIAEPTRNGRKALELLRIFDDGQPQISLLSRTSGLQVPQLKAFCFFIGIDIRKVAGLEDFWLWVLFREPEILARKFYLTELARLKSDSIFEASRYQELIEESAVGDSLCIELLRVIHSEDMNVCERSLQSIEADLLVEIIHDEVNLNF